MHSAYRGETSRLGWTTEADLLEGPRTNHHELVSIVTSPTGLLLVAVADDGTVVGCCHLDRRDESAYFGMFAVAPYLQGRRVGHALLAEAERIAADEWGAPTMRMHVIAQRTDIIGWYERRGYRQTGATEPFPYDDPNAGTPLRTDLVFAVLEKPLTAGRG